MYATGAVMNMEHREKIEPSGGAAELKAQSVMRAAGSVSIATIGTAGMIRKAGSKCASLPSPTRKMNGV